MRKLLIVLVTSALVSCGDYQTGKDIQQLQIQIDSLKAQNVRMSNYLIQLDTMAGKRMGIIEQAVLENRKKLSK